MFQPGRALRRMDLAGTMLRSQLKSERSKAACIASGSSSSRGIPGRAGSLEGLFLRLGGHPGEAGRGSEVYPRVGGLRGPTRWPACLVSGLYEMPAGLMLEVQGPKREFLLPFKREFVKQVDRQGRMLVVELPEGLVEL